MPAAGLVAHTLVSRFVDHLPYYRQEAINARSNVHTPCATSVADATSELFRMYSSVVLLSRS